MQPKMGCRETLGRQSPRQVVNLPQGYNQNRTRVSVHTSNPGNTAHNKHWVTGHVERDAVTCILAPHTRCVGVQTPSQQPLLNILPADKTRHATQLMPFKAQAMDTGGQGLEFSLTLKPCDSGGKGCMPASHPTLPTAVACSTKAKLTQPATPHRAGMPQTNLHP